MTRRQLILANFLAFQVGWLLCVLAGAGRWHWAGSLLIGVMVAFHLWGAKQFRAECQLIVLALLIGLGWDSLLVTLGLLQYEHGLVNSNMAPHWIIALWALFASTLNVSLRWLKDRWLVATMFGAIGGPLAYWGGAKLGAVTIPDQTLALLTLTIGWAVMTPALVLLSKRFDGFPHLERSR